jgi:hypothetical protein
MTRKLLAITILTGLFVHPLAAISESPKNGENSMNSAENDPLIGSIWIFLGVNHQKINQFTFLKNGKVQCENTYNNATWKRIDQNNILFGYGIESSYIVFRLSDQSGKNMTGFHYSGRPRYLERVK